MLLQELCKYNERISSEERVPPFYKKSPVRYLIRLDEKGNLLTPQPIDTAQPDSEKSKYGKKRLVPNTSRSSNTKPLLIADKPDYVLGPQKDTSKKPGTKNRGKERHESYLHLLRKCYEETELDSVNAILQFLENGNPRDSLDLPDDFDEKATLTFVVDGQHPTEYPAIQKFWFQHNSPETLQTLQCIVCREERPILSTLPKVKGVPNGQPSGTSLISANEKAFESYGLTQSHIAPTCPQCATAFTAGLNALLADQSNTIRLGGSTFSFWTREETDFPFASVLNNPDPKNVTALLRRVETGGESVGVDANRFFGLSLAGNSGRATVRDWIDITTDQAQERLAVWFEQQNIVKENGTEGTPFGVYALCNSTVREPSDLPPGVPNTLIRAILTGTPFPLSLLANAIRRVRAENKITQARAALIKAVLTTTSNQHTATTNKKGHLVSLNADNPNPAYQCGRLLSVLESIQKTALPGLNATIVDRYFGTASSAPASVFGRLIRGAQPHLSTLKRDNTAAYHALDRKIETVLTQIEQFPPSLNLQDQGMFCLGYYHQRANDRKEAIDRKEANKKKPGKETQQENSPEMNPENKPGIAS